MAVPGNPVRADRFKKGCRMSANSKIEWTDVTNLGSVVHGQQGRNTKGRSSARGCFGRRLSGKNKQRLEVVHALQGVASCVDVWTGRLSVRWSCSTLLFWAPREGAGGLPAKAQTANRAQVCPAPRRRPSSGEGAGQLPRPDWYHTKTRLTPVHGLCAYRARAAS